ncbi:MAG: type II secretion system protein [bacterium]|nr:type II secretion system protein [bacterium]
MKAFTLAEVLITLAIIGVVAAMSIPSVISNSQQQEFKTGLRKAVSVLNSAITMNMALDGETPYDNANLFGFLQKHMSVMKSTTNMKAYYYPSGGWDNAVFYTTDGMRFELRQGYMVIENTPLYENPSIFPCLVNQTGNLERGCGGCGSLGLNNNPDNTTKPPCLIMVDVNGDRKPNPQNASCMDETCAKQNKLRLSDPEGKKLTDLFTIMITEKQAIPFGTAAQKAMYQAQRN